MERVGPRGPKVTGKRFRPGKLNLPKALTQRLGPALTPKFGVEDALKEGVGVFEDLAGLMTRDRPTRKADDEGMGAPINKTVRGRAEKKGKAGVVSVPTVMERVFSHVGQDCTPAAAMEPRAVQKGPRFGSSVMVKNIGALAAQPKGGLGKARLPQIIEYRMGGFFSGEHVGDLRRHVLNLPRLEFSG